MLFLPARELIDSHRYPPAQLRTWARIERYALGPLEERSSVADRHGLFRSRLAAPRRRLLAPSRLVEPS
jgi:hypothetical protein